MVIRRFRPHIRQQSGGEFAELIEPHLNHLYQLAFRFCNNRSDAEDLVQDVVLKLLPRHSDMVQIEKLRPWLARVLYHQFVDQYRRQERAALTSVDDNEDGFDLYPDTSNDSPESLTEADIQQRRLQRALQQLNDDQRAVVLLHDVEGYTLVELETILDSPQGTLKSRLNRARARLRDFLQKCDN